MAKFLGICLLILQVVLLTLWFVGVVTAPLWQVLLPLIIGIAFMIVLALLACVLIGSGNYKPKK
ncbi:hypothetical protein LI142_08335 [Eubacterium limosum]|uniref:hypothetical protein n=1 Tax=Eubacterium limosum TaxID=1736 RepID=UPI001D08F393|nr:hypothetical protein [Eubacterium limosum]MCB6569507.1 hypothetical protein [Eubacterium limosum]